MLTWKMLTKFGANKIALSSRGYKTSRKRCLLLVTLLTADCMKPTTTQLKVMDHWEVRTPLDIHIVGGMKSSTVQDCTTSPS